MYYGTRKTYIVFTFFSVRAKHFEKTKNFISVAKLQFIECPSESHYVGV